MSDVYYTINKKQMGYATDIGSSYAAVGIPSFEHFSDNKITEGSVDIYKKDSLINDRFSYLETLTRKTFFFNVANILFVDENLSSSSVLGQEPPSIRPFSEEYPPLIQELQNALVLESDFGRAVSICNNICAISSTEAIFSLPLVNNTIYTSAEVVEVYDLDEDSTTPIWYLTTSDIPEGMDTGSASFGKSVAVNNNFLVVGNPNTYSDGTGSQYKGIVYIFTGSIDDGYEYFGFLTGSNRDNDFLFGNCLALDKTTNTLVVGNGSMWDAPDTPITPTVYLFQFISGSWIETESFTSQKIAENMNFFPVAPYSTDFHDDVADGYGSSVAIYAPDNITLTVVIGAPYDRDIVPYSGSTCNRNGAAYIYEKIWCYESSGSVSATASHFQMTRISGDENSFVDNRFGHSVGVYEDNVVVSCPNYLSEFSSSYIINTLFDNSFDIQNLSDIDYNGMFYVYQKISGSWNPAINFKKRKLFGYPHAFFGYSTAIYDNNIIIGSPVVIVDDADILIEQDKSISENFSSNLQGSFYIYDLIDYASAHHVGNVFYKNGKLVLSTTGSIFDTMFENGYNEVPQYEIYFSSKNRIYEKEILCTINPTEFNYSTNPTSYTYAPYASLDLNENGQFDFEDCDTILRMMYRSIYGTETWWQIIPPSASSVSADAENSLFKYYSPVFPPPVSALTTDEFNTLYSEYGEVLDINDDGVININDIYLLWLYFSNQLLSTNFSQYLGVMSITSTRNTFSALYDYLNTITGKNKLPAVLPAFLEKSRMTSMNPTASFLAPYITTVGLYSGIDLIATAKLGTPIRNNGDFPLNLLIRFDI